MAFANDNIAPEPKERGTLLDPYFQYKKEAYEEPQKFPHFRMIFKKWGLQWMDCPMGLGDHNPVVIHYC